MNPTTIEPHRAGRNLLDEARKNPADLDRRAIRGGLVTLSAQAAKVVIQFASITALSRLLDPADFGLFAMAAAVVGLVELFKDFGLSMATVQRASITHDQVSTLFWLNSAAGIVLGLLVAAIAPVLGWACREPRLVGLTATIAAALAIGGLTVQHVALLRRRLRFGLLAAIEVGSQVAGVSAAIGVAAIGGGPWALAVQPTVAALATLVIVVATADWRPSFLFRWDEARPMIGFGVDMAGCNVLSYLCKTIDNVLIGWWWGPSPLGVYTRAYAILVLPVTQINAPIAAVAVPVLSRLRGDAEAFSAAFLKFVRFLLALTTPACFVMFLFAPEVVRVLLGDRWSMAIPVLRTLSIASLALPIWYVSGWLFVSTGRTRIYLRLWVFLTISLASAFAIGLLDGILGVARAYAVGVWLLAVPIVGLATRGGGVGLGRFLGAIVPPVLACIPASILALAIDAAIADRAGSLTRLVSGSILLLAGGLMPLGARSLGDRLGKSAGSAKPVL